MHAMTNYLVDEQASCVDCLVNDGDTSKAKDIYLGFMRLFKMIVSAGYILDETGLKCRLDAVNIKQALVGRGVEL